MATRTETKETEQKANLTEQKTEPTVEQQVERPQTLAELLGRHTTELLTALQGTNAAEKQAAIAKCTREMRIWYDAQPVDGRKDSARAARKQLENFKMVAEQFFQEMMIISAQDVQ